MIMQLRKDWVAQHPGPRALKPFHAQCLTVGGPPSPLGRAQMLGGKAQARLWSAATPAAQD